MFTRDSRNQDHCVKVSMVQRHGGTISIESEEGKGTVVVIRLPVLAPAVETWLASGMAGPPPREEM